MDIDKILELFCLISGLSSDAANTQKIFCENSLSNITENLKLNANTTQYDARLNFLAAALAYYEYKLFEVSREEVAITDTSNIVNLASSIFNEKKIELLAIHTACKMSISQCESVLQDKNFLVLSIL
ncbi:MAG: hypothetical protein NkDv07_0268 [Candidatus Improbicoccus devescovinae]|nr:MAG: hypothetical protein NkDv07_0268 [Candidatus Improbicoccus devescovinae]